MSYSFSIGGVARVIPDRMIGGLIRYINEGVVPGGFLLAVLDNDLREACGRADSENLSLLPAYVAFLYNEAPAGCSGSPGKVAAWVDAGGLVGMKREPMVAP